MRENQEIEKKSLKIVLDKNPHWKELAKECICFANSRGGKILIGIEKYATIPPANQTIRDNLIEKIYKNIEQITFNVGIAPRKVVAENGGEYIELIVFRNVQTIASSSDGRYYIRVSDECHPLLPDELGRLMVDKNAYTWETQTSQKVNRDAYNKKKFQDFVDGIRESDRVSKFIKEKSDEEILEHYFFVKSEYLTNLGILWIGKREDRATLLYSPSIQFIKYDEYEYKVNKIVWADFNLNPIELIESVLKDIPDWTEGIEIPDGIFRKNIPNYDDVVIRELVANALVHRPYTIRGDIFINLYVDKLEIHNPGLLPLGVTPKNILHQSIRRNEHLSKVFYDLKIMEREGSGYDMMYEVLLTSGKHIPIVQEGNDRVVVTIKKRIINTEVIRLIDKVNQYYQLRQKELICLGLIPQHNLLSAIELGRILDLKKPNSIRHWLGRLLKMNIIQSKGKTKGKGYFVNPEILRKLKFKGKTDLKKIEPYRLGELIKEDLKIYKESSISEIRERIGREISLQKIRIQLSILIKKDIIDKKGITKNTKYFIKKV